MKFGKRLNLLLEENDISLSQLSTETGIAKSTLHNYVCGGEPTLSKLQILAEFFECSIDSMVNGIREKDPIEVILKREVERTGVYEITVRKKKI